MPAKRQKLRKAAEARGAATATAGEPAVPPTSDTSEGPVEASVKEQIRPVEMESMGPEEKEAEGPVEEEATVPLIVVPPEEATASSPPAEEPREEGHQARSPTPTCQAHSTYA